MGMHRRIVALEGRARRANALGEPSPSSSAARGRMREHLDRLAALRRDELDEEEREEVEAVNSAIRRRLDGLKGEGGKL